MQIRTHIDGQTVSEAVYSDCALYRYSLTRVWNPEARRIAFVMLNPSKADERRNDPTVARCEARARVWGFGAFRVINIFAWCATDPRDLRRAAFPEGRDNEATLVTSAGWADLLVAAWGVHGAHRGRGALTAKLLAGCGTPVHHLGLTKDGHPRHPLYLPFAQQPEPWHLPDPN